MSRKTNYHEKSFWEARYKESICEWYEWLATPNQIVPLFKDSIPLSSKILELGCGSSNLAEKLMTMGHQSVTCLDFSKQIIKKKQSQAKQGITYQTHDITQPMTFLGDEIFDVIIEKNTMDCLFCFDYFPPTVMKTMKECFRVLKKGGVMISISHGKEKMRKFFYCTRFSPFAYQLQVIKGDQLKQGHPDLFIYILTKEEEGQGGRARSIRDEEESSGQDNNGDDDKDEEEEKQKSEKDQGEDEEDGIPQEDKKSEQKQQQLKSESEKKEEQNGQNYQNDGFDVVQ